MGDLNQSFCIQGLLVYLVLSNNCKTNTKRTWCTQNGNKQTGTQNLSKNNHKEIENNQEEMLNN